MRQPRGLRYSSAMPQDSIYAAVDLGSNSFHLLVARREHGELRVLDRIREMVRLGGGLSAEGQLDQETQNRAYSCLARFGQRLRGIPAENIRAVGTQTFRRLNDGNAFLMNAETALECGIDVIGGREEARLIYLGVSQDVSGHKERRLVIDIGGGSTELVIGEGPHAIELESLQYGCVSVTKQYFSSGKVSRKRFRKGLRSVRRDMQEIELRYRQSGWEAAIGTSGTLRAIATICQLRGWIKRDVEYAALMQLKDVFIASGSTTELDLSGLSERRKPVLIGGLVVAVACFKSLGIKQLKVSDFALREGVLHDLLGRIEHRDPRDKTVQAFKSRSAVDEHQVARVKQCALDACGQIANGLFLEDAHRKLLGWAADLHETGLSLSHSQFQRHSGYLVENSDMAGFTRQEQMFLAALVYHHRRAIPDDLGRHLPARLHEPLRITLFCLRFACILCRTRDDKAVPTFRLEGMGQNISVTFPPNWIRHHPLTMTDLGYERSQLDSVGLRFCVNGLESAEGEG